MSFIPVLSRLGLAVGLSLVVVSTAFATPAWQPQSSERLVKLPPRYLEKSIEHDFAQSALGTAMQETESTLGLKGSTLNDLQQALANADGEIRTNLRHQFLSEKRAYLDLMAQRNSYRRQQLETKHRLFQDMLQRLTSSTVTQDPEAAEILALQNAAADRFETSLEVVDQSVLDAPHMAESRYAQAYSENRQALEQVMKRINNHDMTRVPATENGVALSHKDHIRHMVSAVQSDLALLQQEETLLGYMAKLVALDAMALAEEGLDAERADGEALPPLDPAQNVSFFLTN